MSQKRVPEEWRPVVGFGTGEYFISSRGRLKIVFVSTGLQWEIVRRGSRRKPSGYVFLFLEDSNGKRRFVSVHSLVAAAFIGPRPPGHHINHRDGKPWNNRLENLEYCTPLENVRHAMHVLGRLPGPKNKRRPRRLAQWKSHVSSRKKPLRTV